MFSILLFALYFVAFCLMAAEPKQPAPVSVPIAIEPTPQQPTPIARKRRNKR